MKTTDISKKVMEKIAAYERVRTRVWFIGFSAAILALCVSYGWLFVMIVRDLLERQAFDVFELFQEDPEIIAEFWRDVLDTFISELPIELVYTAAAVCVAAIVFLLYTNKRREIMVRKYRALDKYT